MLPPRLPVPCAAGLRPRPPTRRGQSIEGEAADLYLRGRFYWNQRTEVSLKQAIEYFQQSIARAPGYAPSYAALADCYAAMVYSCYLAPATGFAQARAALERARQLDAQAPEVLASEGYLNLYFDWDLNKATRNLEQAIAANPNYATAYDWLGVLYTASRRFNAGRTAFDRARRLDPASLPIRTDLAFHLHYSGRNEEARQELLSILGVDPNFPLAHFWMGRVLSSESNCSGALSELETASSSSLRDWQPVIAAHGHIAGVCGQPSRALEDLRRLRWDRPDQVCDLLRLCTDLCGVEGQRAGSPVVAKGGGGAFTLAGVDPDRSAFRRAAQRTALSGDRPGCVFGELSRSGTVPDGPARAKSSSYRQMGPASDD